MVKENKLKQIEEENQTILNDLKRVQAEFDNYRKREENLHQERINQANERLIRELLPVIDNLELAILNTPKDDESLKGIKMIYTQLFSILEQYGLKKMQSKGLFNPELHEAMLIENSEQEQNEIIEVFVEGYYLHDKVIRHAKVKLSGGQK